MNTHTTHYEDLNMKQNITFSQFVDAFRDHGRAEQFSYDALRALFDYARQYEEGTGEELELDVIAICCEWCEYENCIEAARQYDWTPDNEYDETNEDDIEAMEEEANEWLLDHTTVRGFGGGVIIANF